MPLQPEHIVPLETLGKCVERVEGLKNWRIHGPDENGQFTYDLSHAQKDKKRKDEGGPRILPRSIEWQISPEKPNAPDTWKQTTKTGIQKGPGRYAKKNLR